MTEKGSHLVLFPTVASPLGDTNRWSADVHGWCYDFDELRNFQRTTANLLRRSLKLPKGVPDPPFFRERATGFVVENRGKLAVEIAHGGTPAVSMFTKRNGHYRGTLSIEFTPDPAKTSQTAHGSWKTILAARQVELGLTAQGTVHLPGLRGLSIISDIDDTIKFTNVGNKRELLANTFLRSFRSIEGMPELFQRLAQPEVSFHYISATPWQMYGAVAGFLAEHNFPEGSIHLRKFALKDATILKKIFPAYKKKRKVIESLMLRFPQRKFLLIGDTGEKDPELYGEIARKYPEQTLGICVRNVSVEAPDSLRYRRAFAHVPSESWIVYEDALRLEEQFLPGLLTKWKNAEDPVPPVLPIATGQQAS